MILKKTIKIFNLSDVFGSVYSKDRLPKLKKGKFCIINMQKSTDGGGTHWVSLYYNYPLYSIYFDSYGRISSLDIQNEITPHIFNDIYIQDYNASSCGYYAIAQK